MPEKIKNIIKVLFCDPEDVSEKTKDLLSEFERTDTYKSMSSEFKSQLKSLMGYEYESKEEAEEGMMQLLRCFESQKEPNLEIKVSAKKGYTVYISDNRKDKKIPNTYTGELNFEISEKLSITSLHILSFILSLSLLLVGILWVRQLPTNELAGLLETNSGSTRTATWTVAITTYPDTANLSIQPRPDEQRSTN